MSFAELKLASPLVEALLACGYTQPTTIQSETIPALLAGRDVIASAQTGTGKTAAFVLPALDRLAANPKAPVAKHRLAGAPRVLVLAPTRELAQQVAEQVVRYAQNLRVRTVCLYGGAPYPVQNRQLARGVDVLVATPGRLMDHVDRQRVDLSKVEMLILDEADRMLDMGFIDDVEKICAMTPATRQTALFSATLDGAIGKLAAKLTRNPLRVDVKAERAAPLKIEQHVHFADDRSHKYRLLDHVLADVSIAQSIVFISTKRDAEALALKLQGEGHAAAALHGDMNQRERNRTLSDVRRGGVRTLVATDVAARGIDVAGISHVINFDLPRQAEDYVHRIGRTGRAGASGVAVSFANHAERGMMRQIERFTGAVIPTRVIAGLEPRLRETRHVPGRRPAPGKPSHGRPAAKSRNRTESRWNS